MDRYLPVITSDLLTSFIEELMQTLVLCSYASDVTSGLSDGYEGQSEKSERAASKLFRRRARSRLRLTGVRPITLRLFCQLG